MDKRYFVKAGFTEDKKIVAIFVGPTVEVPKCKEFFYKDSNGDYKSVERPRVIEITLNLLEKISNGGEGE